MKTKPIEKDAIDFSGLSSFKARLIVWTGVTKRIIFKGFGWKAGFIIWWAFTRAIFLKGYLVFKNL